MVAIVSTIIGFLTLTESGQVAQPFVPTVRVVVGGLQFAVAGAAVLAVMFAALGLKPGGSRFLLVVSMRIRTCCCGAQPAYHTSSCLVLSLACIGLYCLYRLLPWRELDRLAL